MKKLHRLLKSTGVLLTLVLLFFTACEKNSDPDPLRLGLEYFPLAKGEYRLYDVYRINYNFVEENDTLRYELKEVVEDFFIDQQKDTTYILRRYQRSAMGASWQLDSAYLLKRTKRWVVQTANNRPQINLAFPVVEGQHWNSNMLNASKTDDYTMIQVAKPYQLGDQVYEQTLTVEQENQPETIVQTDMRHEVYALGIGMVYKQTKLLNYCTDQSCAGQFGIISTGLYLEMKLKEAGTEPK